MSRSRFQLIGRLRLRVWRMLVQGFGVGWAAFGLVAGDPSPGAQWLRNLPPPPLPPVAQFTQLFGASPEERTNQLAGKPAPARDLILRQLAQFDALTTGEREQRILQLRVAQLRYYLAPLLRLPREQRGQLLTNVPATDQPLIETQIGRAHV